MQKRNRLRLSSCTEKLETRELLSGSHCCCSMPQVSASGSDAASPSSDTSTASTNAAAGNSTTLNAGTIDNNAANGVDTSEVDTSGTNAQQELFDYDLARTAVETESTNALTTTTSVGSSGNQVPVVINNYNSIRGGFGQFQRFAARGNSGSFSDNIEGAQVTSEQFGTSTGGVTINNVNSIGGFGRFNRFAGGFAQGNGGFCSSTSGNTTGNVGSGTNTSNAGTVVQEATSNPGITINNINQINGFGGQFTGNFQGQLSGNAQGQSDTTNQQSDNVDTSIGSTREFNGNTYTLIKSKENKLTYKNPSLNGGQRTVDFNVVTGTFKTHSPIVLDLNGSGAIETTGASTAKDRVAGTAVGKTVSFDINGDGAKENIEWLIGNGDGFLVDDRDGGAAKGMNGSRLFGDANGQYSSGYEKLAKLDVDGNGVLSGSELKGLKVWQDNGNAKVQAGELKSLADVGIDQISVQRQDVVNTRGETLMQSVAQRNGQSILTEDVWFGQA